MTHIKPPPSGTLWSQPPSVAVRTSIAAAEQIKPKADALRQMVLRHIEACGDAGATDEEGMLATGMQGNTYRPRRIELWHAGLVKDNGCTRRTVAGRAAIVWVAVSRGERGE